MQGRVARVILDNNVNCGGRREETRGRPAWWWLTGGATQSLPIAATETSRDMLKAAGKMCRCFVFRQVRSFMGVLRVLLLQMLLLLLFSLKLLLLLLLLLYLMLRLLLLLPLMSWSVLGETTSNDSLLTIHSINFVTITTIIYDSIAGRSLLAFSIHLSAARLFQAATAIFWYLIMPYNSLSAVLSSSDPEYPFHVSNLHLLPVLLPVSASLQLCLVFQLASWCTMLFSCPSTLSSYPSAISSVLRVSSSLELCLLLLSVLNPQCAFPFLSLLVTHWVITLMVKWSKRVYLGIITQSLLLMGCTFSVVLAVNCRVLIQSCTLTDSDSHWDNLCPAL